MWGEDVEAVECPRPGCQVVCRGLSSLAGHIGIGHASTKLQERRSKEGLGRVVCAAPGCEYTYATQGSMRRHMRKAHPGCSPADEVQYYCTNASCIASFPTEAGLRQHRRHCDNVAAYAGAGDAPADETPEEIKCNVCPKVFTSRGGYLTHRALHQKYGHVPYKIIPADS